MSSKDPWYRQCTYEKPANAGMGKMIGVSWLPEKLAKIGKKIYFGERTDKSIELWTIIFVGGRKRESFLVAHMMAYKNQRKVSDV